MTLEPIIIKVDVESNDNPIEMDVLSVDQDVDVNPELEIDVMTNKDYNELDNKPSINGVTLIGDKSFPNLNLLSLTNQEIEYLLS